MPKKNYIKTTLKERRKYSRIKKSLKVEPCSLDYLLKGNFLSKDISEAGMCILSPYTMEIGETVELAVHLPDCEEPVVCFGKVVRRNEIEDERFPFLLGIKFTKIDMAAHDKLCERLRFYELIA